MTDQTPLPDSDHVAGSVAALEVGRLLQRLVSAGFDPAAVIAGAHGTIARAASQTWGHRDASRLLRDTATLLETMGSTDDQLRALVTTRPVGRA